MAFYIDPLGWIFTAGMQIISLIGGGLGTALTNIGLGAVTLVLIVKYWPILNLLLFVYAFWTLNKYLMKLYNQAYKFLNKWVFPLVIPIVGDTLGISGVGQKKVTLEYIVKHLDKVQKESKQ